METTNELGAEGLEVPPLRRLLGSLRIRHALIWLLWAVWSGHAPAWAQDLDGDGVLDALDNCVDTWNPDQLDPGGDGYGLACDCDFDGNHFTNASDFDLFVNQFELPIGSPAFDADFDFDTNGYVAVSDFNVFVACWGTTPGPSGPLCSQQGLGCSSNGDIDQDGVEDALDNCTGVANPSQLDSDGDLVGNICDGDFDGDGFVSSADVTYFACGVGDPSSFPETDLNGDGSVWLDDYAILDAMLDGPPGPSSLVSSVGDPSVTSLFDSDADGVLDYLDNCRLVPNAGQENPDLDAFGLACDADYDGDGSVGLDDFDAISALSNIATGEPGFDPDMDHDLDGIIDADDIAFASSQVGLPAGPTGLFCAPQPGSGETPVAVDGFIRLERGGEYWGRVSGSDPNGLPVTFQLVSGPAEGTLTRFDPNTGEFLYTSSATGSLERDSFDFEVSDGTLVSLPGRVTLEHWTPANADYASEGLGSSALVVYNANAPDSQALAEYYAAARGIPAAQLCPVRLPNGLYAHKDDLLAAQQTILADCICPLIPAPERPVPCGAAAPEAVAAVSPIRHLVLMRGLPARLHGTPWPTDAEEPALDHYLAHLLANPGDPFAPGSYGSVPDAYGDDSLAPYHRLAIRPDLDRRLAYGRIEAITKERTEALIDRTLLAEAAGFSGKILTETLPLFDVARRRTGDLGSACEGSVATGVPVPNGCRAQTTASSSPSVVDGSVPGEPWSSVPLVVDAGLFLGGQPSGNGQAGFDGASNLEHWRKALNSSCVPRCDAQPVEAYRGLCEAASTDWFRELETSGCVGVAPGFVGMQLRSYTVTGYGFRPTGWQGAGSGAQGQTAALEQPVGGYVGGAFSDTAYVHYGVHDLTAGDGSLCPRVAGPDVVCPEAIGLYLEADASPPAALPVVGTRSFTVQLRYRGQASPGASLRVSLVFTDLAGASYTAGPVTLDVSGGAASWALASAALDAAAASGGEVAGLAVRIAADVPDGVRGWLDLDAVEVLDDATGTNLLPVDVGGFAVAGPRQVHLGDWAANAIDRLGAVGWWGSSSHHLTAGFAFDDQTAMLGAFLAGRTLGEAVAASGRPESGLLYGDPLYRPSAAALYFPSEAISKAVATVGGPAPTPLVVDAEHLETYRYLFVNAFHGSANEASVRWQISVCSGLDEAACDASSGWTLALDRTGSAREVPIDWSQEILAPGGPQQVTLRLQVWNDSDPAEALYDYLHLDYQPGLAAP